MTTSIPKSLRNWFSHPRRVALLAAVAAIAVASSTAITDAAWTDTEWTHGDVGVSSPGTCATNTLFSNRSWGRQLSGMVLNTSLDSIAGVDGVAVANSGALATPTPNNATVTKVDATTYTAKLPVSVLTSSVIAPALGLGLPVGGVGTYTQWAQANNNGTAYGASGLVSDQTGAVDVAGTANGATSAPLAASINLARLVPDALARLSLDVGAVASSARVDACTAATGWPAMSASPAVSRNYGIAGVNLNAGVPALGPVATQGAVLVSGVTGQLTTLASATGALTTGTTDGVAALVNPLLGGLELGSIGSTTTLTTPDLSGVTALLTQSMSDPDGVLTVDLSAGTVRVNIASLVGGPNGLNSLEPNHEVILDATTLNTLTGKLTALLDSWKNRVVTALTTALNSVSITVATSISLVALMIPVAAIDVNLGPIRVGQLLDDSVAPPAPTVGTKVLGADLGGVVAAVLTPITAVLLSGANGVVKNVLRSTLFGPGALVPALASNLQGLTAPVVTAVGGILTSFDSLVSIRVNVQPDQAWPGGTKPSDVAALVGEYKVSALRVGLVNSAGLLGLSLANSSAGPAAIHP